MEILKPSLIPSPSKNPSHPPNAAGDSDRASPCSFSSAEKESQPGPQAGEQCSGSPHPLVRTTLQDVLLPHWGEDLAPLCHLILQPVKMDEQVLNSYFSMN